MDIFELAGVVRKLDGPAENLAHFDW